MPVSTFSSRAWASRDDTRRIQDLVRARLVRDWPALRFHPGDIDWWVVGTYGRVPAMSERVRLWFEGDGDARGETPVGYGWFGPPSDLDFVVGYDDPGEVAALLAEIVAWADERRASLAETAIGPLRPWASLDDEAGLAALRGLGFEREDRPGFVHFTGDLAVIDRWPPPGLPAGLTSRPLNDVDVPARVVCGHAAFPGSTQTEERYRTVSDTWLYRRDLDRIVLADDGRVVAFALAWFDPETRVAELEPVGVHPDWHRKGLGTEVCRAALRAARALGAQRAMIASDRSNLAAMNLYTTLGLSITAEIVPLARPVAQAAPEAAHIGLTDAPA